MRSTRLRGLWRAGAAGAWLLLAACATGPSPGDTQIRERLAAIRTAILARQPEGIVRWGTEDWTMVDAAGQSFDRAAYLVRVRGLFERLEAIESLDTRIDRLALAGDRAVVELTQTMVRRERDAAGRVTRAQVRYREAQDWVRVAGEWRMRQVRFVGAMERLGLDVK